MRYSALVMLFFAMCFFCGGCSNSETGTLEGTVKLPNGPLTAGSVGFHHTVTGFSIASTIQPDGSFTVRTSKGEGLPVGEYRIAILPDAFPVTEGTQVLVNPRSAAAVKAAKAVPIPAKYRSAATSPLKTTVKPGKNPPLELMLTP